MIKFERIAEFSGADYAIVHTGIDEQRDGYKPLDRLSRIRDSGRLNNLAVAGGIGPNDISRLVDLLVEGVIIVGASITKANRPAEVACSIVNALNLRKLGP